MKKPTIMRTASFFCFAAIPFLAGCAIYDPLLQNSLLEETKGLDEAGFVENYGTPYRICTYKPTGERSLHYKRIEPRKQPAGQPAQAIYKEGKRRWGYRRVDQSSKENASCWFTAYFKSDGTFVTLYTGETKENDCAYMGEEPNLGWRKKK